MPVGCASTEQCQAALTANGFEVYLAKNPVLARQVFFNEILPNVKHDLVSWADSMTMQATGVMDP